MGYTSGAAMEDRGLRDIERWRDKIEVRLDNRQVFFLFFGSALVACMLFVLGVIVGKRLESRGRAVSPEIEDPLALLDKVATSPRPPQAGVTFPQALFGTTGKNVEKHGKKGALPLPAGTNGEAATGKTVALIAPEDKPIDVVAKAAPAASLGSESKPVAAKPEPKAAVDKKPEPKAAVDKKPEPKPAAEKKPVENKAALAKAAEAKDSKPVAIPTVAAGGDIKSKGHFTLQLSSFQDKAEAEAFAKKFDGERPYMVVSDIPEKGTWYRVRVGDYVSAKEAVAAKQSFEKRHGVIAYVAQK